MTAGADGRVGAGGVEQIVEVDRIDGKSRSVRELFVGRRYSVDYYARVRMV